MGLYPLVRTWTCGFAADHGHVTLDEAISIKMKIYGQDPRFRGLRASFWDRAPVSFIMTPSRGFGPRRIPLAFVEIACMDLNLYLNELVAVC